MKLTYTSASAAAKSAVASLQPVEVKTVMPAYLAIYGPYKTVIMDARKRGVKPEAIVRELEKHGVRTPLMARWHSRGQRISPQAYLGGCIMIGKLCNHKG